MSEVAKKTLAEKLIAIQAEIKAPKEQWNNFGGYNYRSCEDILEAAKPLLLKNDVLVTLSDELEMIGDRFYTRATAMAKSGEEKLYVTAYAREQETKKGMDGAQITGAASSYARKYALNGLFLIDDNKDSDEKETKPKKGKQQPATSPEEPPAAPVGVDDTSTGIPSDYQVKTGEKNGKSWTKHGFKFGDKWFSTFSKTDAEFILDAKAEGLPVIITFTTSGQYSTIKSVVLANV